MELIVVSSFIFLNSQFSEFFECVTLYWLNNCAFSPSCQTPAANIQFTFNVWECIYCRYNIQMQACSISASVTELFSQHGSLRVYRCYSMCQNYIPLCVDTLFYSLTYLSMHTWVSSIFWQVWVVLLWTQMCKYFFSAFYSLLAYSLKLSYGITW